MSRTIQVRQLLEDTIRGLNEQLRENGFTESDIKEFQEQPIDAVEETLQDTTYYLYRNADNKVVTIKDNRTIVATEYLVVEKQNGLKELYEEVIDIYKVQKTNELRVTVRWGGEQTARDYINLDDIKSYYYIDNPNHNY